MPQIKPIIFLKGKLREDIKTSFLDEKSGLYLVKFKGGEEKIGEEYDYVPYKPENVEEATFVRQLNPPLLVTRRSDGFVYSNVKGVRLFEGKEHSAYRVVFENGDTKDYDASHIEIEEHIDDARSVNVWQYLNEIAQYIQIPTEDEEKKICLGDRYSRMEFVAKGSLLEAYLNVNTYSNKPQAISTPIFPFGCNRSQYKAVRNALENKISVIQGPPGTGKTQTILNILANLLMEGKTMEIVSNNNSAVENVKEKLEAFGLDYLCAQLGRATNKEEFIEGQTGQYPDFSGWRTMNARRVLGEAIALSKELQELYEWQEQLAICSEKLAEYKLQSKRFPARLTPKRRWPADVLEKYSLLSGREMDRKHRLSWWTRVRLRYHRLPATEEAPDQLRYLFVDAKIRELEERCKAFT